MLEIGVIYGGRERGKNSVEIALAVNDDAKAVIGLWPAMDGTADASGPDQIFNITALAGADMPAVLLFDDAEETEC